MEYLTIRDIGKDNDIVVKHIVRDGEGKEAGWTLISPRNRRNRQHTFNQGKQRVQFDNPRRNGSQSGAWRDKDGWGGTKVVTYYFNNFPNNIGIEALWKLFMKWGRVVEVFVRGKKNKEGRAFGFVRFKEVPYPQELERRLDQIWIGTYKLRAFFNLMQPTRKGAFFVDVVKGKRMKKIWQKKNGVDTEIWRGLDYNVKEDEIVWLNNCFVGYVHNPNVVYLLQDRIIEEGVTTFFVVPMGGIWF